MAPESTANGEWNEYRRMIVSWHEDEVADRRDIREKLEATNKQVNDKLDGLSTQLAALKTERRVVLVLMGVVAPVVISAGVSLIFGLR
jgi:hypothetical protein